MSVIRALAGADRFACILGVNPGFVPRSEAPLPALVLPEIAGETISLRTLWRSRAVARAVQVWLRADARRVFHAHSRAGLLVALELARRGERRVFASVHCYGRQRWFYRWAAARLGGRLYWLSPAMKRYYGIGIANAGEAWAHCIPGAVPVAALAPHPARRKREGILRLGGVGALVAWKGWHLVLAALAALPREQRDRIRFIHIGAPGDSPAEQRYAADLRAETERLGLAACVEWRGQQASAQALLAEIDCLVVASHNEPFSIAVLEAQAAAVPVLAANSGGAADLLVADRTGWFFQSDSATDLSRAIGLLLNESAWSRIDLSPETVRPYTAPVIAERWVKVYAAA
jgi:glycosyltransferase involved in cell wall biosynthesis